MCLNLCFIKFYTKPQDSYTVVVASQNYILWYARKVTIFSLYFESIHKYFTRLLQPTLLLLQTCELAFSRV